MTNTEVIEYKDEINQESTETNQESTETNQESTEMNQQVKPASSTTAPQTFMNPPENVVPAACSCETESTEATTTEHSYVYAIGKIEAQFPNISVEKEFRQVAKDGATANLTDQQVLYNILKENRYLAREVCWVFSVEGIETYLLLPKTDTELTDLIDSIKPTIEMDHEVIIGEKGPMATPCMCNGLIVPLVTCDQVFPISIEELVNTMPKPKDAKEEQFKESTRFVLQKIMHMTDNVGDMNSHRAMNYLALRYPAIYANTAEMFVKDYWLAGIVIKPSRISSATRSLVEVIFEFTNRNTDYRLKSFVRVDITEKWPFLVSKLAPYHDV